MIQERVKNLYRIAGNVSNFSNIYSEVLDEYINNSYVNYEEYLSDKKAEMFGEIFEKLTNEEKVQVYDYLTDDYSGYITFDSLENLAIAIIKKYREEVTEVLDIGSGKASFIRKCVKEDIGQEYVGEEINNKLSRDSQNLVKLLNLKNVTFKNVDSLKSVSKDRYSVVYSNMPFLNKLTNEVLNTYSSYSSIPIKKSITPDWIFMERLYNSMDDDGLGIAIVRTSILYSHADKEIRRQFSESKNIRAIIRLPEKLSNATAIPTVMIVFDKSYKGPLSMVDATNLYEKKERSLNHMNENNINTVLDAIEEESEISTRIERSILKENDYIWNTAYYLNEETLNLVNPKRLGDIATVFRGRDITKKELNEDADESYAGHLLNIADLDNYLIKGLNQKLSTSLMDKYQKYKIQEKDILLTARGSNLKIAIADKSLVEKDVIASSNIAVIRVTDEKVDPYYILSYLIGEEGKIRLGKLQTGSIILVLSLGTLKDFQVPFVSLESQKNIAEKMKMELAGLKSTIKRLEKFEEKLPNIFESNEKGVN
ncbi:N-6 DNA methylase [Salinicoccus halodurans]|uniref:site-specific DNA-methyltransferase (adenine-specific) n=1 Tax=Salinicoccus halodurans TaxID=407035 RepID=A0A0F7HMP0_9STAP|nr:N-6 DNA methylase [Salinicoccus halodurans]AKG74201.1 hypothetical protein AAT16_08115 [Salinicoccus halodurans]SFK92987.1 type I restriction enzyme M protein [Salinicoccus halodurans]